MAEPWTEERAQTFFDYSAAPKEMPEECDLCGSPTAHEKLASRDRYGFPVQTWRCVECGLVSQWPMLAPEALKAFYAGPYRALVSAWHGRPINRETLEPEQRGYGLRLAHILGREMPAKDSVLLDLGGSTGVVAEVVADCLGYRHVTVVEPCLEEAQAAMDRVSHVLVQAVEDFEPGEERWDLVLLCQTVDHLRSISAVLRKVRGLLAPGGRFFVDAVDSERILEPERYKLDHIYSLTPATMVRYLETGGFQVREVPAPSENHVAYLCEVAS